MTIWRVYENGKPFQTKNYLPWSTTGVKEGDAVFTSGHPGATQRLNTVAHLEFLRDQALPLSIDAFTQIRDSLEAYMKQGPEQARQAMQRHLDHMCEKARKFMAWEVQYGRHREMRGAAFWKAMQRASEVNP